MMIKNIIQFIALFSIVLVISVSGNEHIWLSNSPPPKVADEVKKTGMRRLPVVYGKRRQMNIIQWIQSGELPQNSKYAEPNDLFNAQLFVFDPDGEFLYYFGDSSVGINNIGIVSDLIPDGEGGLWVSDSQDNRLLHYTLP